jgi:uncharacterized protein YndB with AHSA1/START domain
MAADRMATDQVEKSVELKAPLSRVWRALADHKEFGEWFGVKLDGPFVVGQAARGQVTNRGYEHVTLVFVVKAMEPERLFSYTWHPYAVDMTKDYSHETPTLVEFHLKETAGGTLLTVTESGFEKVPEERRAEAFRRNDGGWAQQMRQIEAYLDRQS